MTKKERWIVDDAGTLIDMVTRNTYDYVSEVLPLLNEQNNAINELINSEKYWEKKATQRINEITKENEQLKDFIRKEFPKSHKHILEGFE